MDDEINENPVELGVGDSSGSQKAENDPAQTLLKIDQLAAAKYKACKFKDAVELLQQAYELRSVSLGPENLETIATLNNLAAALGRLHKYEEAEQFLRHVVSVRERLLGESHCDTLVSGSVSDCLNMHSKYLLQYLYSKSPGRRPEASASPGRSGNMHQPSIYGFRASPRCKRSVNRRSSIQSSSTLCSTRKSCSCSRILQKGTQRFVRESGC